MTTKSTSGTGSSLSQEYPSIFCFGSKVEFLSVSQIEKATPGERLASVWPFIVGQTMRFHSRMKPQEAAVFDIEDILHEIAAEVLLKNDKWDPKRGTYTAFVGRIMKNAMLGIRERSHTVQSPRNSTCRTKEYASERDKGELTPARERTWNDILRTFGDAEDAYEFDIPVCDTDVPEEVQSRDTDESLTNAICESLAVLDPMESLVVGSHYGLWGQEEKEVRDILGKDRSRQASKLLSQALGKIRATIDLPRNDNVSL